MYLHAYKIPNAPDTNVWRYTEIRKKVEFKKKIRSNILQECV